MMKKKLWKSCIAVIIGLLLGGGILLSGHSVSTSVNDIRDTVEYAKEEKVLRNVMYYGDWSIWGDQGNFYPSGIPADQLTHLNFAFLDFDADGTIRFTDKDAAVAASAGMPDVRWGDINAGLICAFQDLRAQNPNLRIGISIGGWSKSGDFSNMAADPAARENFVSGVMKFIKYTNMDFVDVDWEYPGSARIGDKVDNAGDEGTPNAQPSDKENYITLLKDLRRALDAQGEELGKAYELTVAIPAQKQILDLGIDIENLFEVVDFANIMTYDMRSARDPITGHHTGLYTNPNDPYADSGLSADASVQYLLSKGAPANKIVIGAAFYIRGWEQVSDNGGAEGLPGLFGAASAINKDADSSPSYGALNEARIISGGGGRCGGIWSYGSMDKLKAKYPGLVEYWDDYAKAPYLYNESTGAFFTFDNTRSVQEKAKYVLDNDLGGMISWMQSQDAQTTTKGRRDELTKAIKQSLFGSDPLPQYTVNNPDLPITAEVKIYSDNLGKGYEVTIKNGSVKDESGEVLSYLETSYETIKLPRLYISTKSNHTFSSGGYGPCMVINEDGYVIVDLSTAYDSRMIGHDGSVTFKLRADGTVNRDDIISIELTQRIIPSGMEISRHTVTFTVTDEE